MSVTWEPVKSGRKVVYWRLVSPTGKHFGAVEPPRYHGGSYRALQYGASTPSDNVELGHYATKSRAQRAVEDAADRMRDES